MNTAQTQSFGFWKMSRALASSEPSAGSFWYSHRAVSGRDMRTDSIRTPKNKYKLGTKHKNHAKVNHKNYAYLVNVWGLFALL